MQAVEWLSEHLDDVRSDMSVLHRVQDPEALDAVRFVAFATRLHAYPGAVSLAVRTELDRQAPATATSAATPDIPAIPSATERLIRAARERGETDIVEVPATPGGTGANAMMADLISWGSG